MTDLYCLAYVKLVSTGRYVSLTAETAVLRSDATDGKKRNKSRRSSSRREVKRA